MRGERDRRSTGTHERSINRIERPRALAKLLNIVVQRSECVAKNAFDRPPSERERRTLPLLYCCRRLFLFSLHTYSHRNISRMRLYERNANTISDFWKTSISVSSLVPDQRPENTPTDLGTPSANRFQEKFFIVVRRLKPI